MNFFSKTHFFMIIIIISRLKLLSSNIILKFKTTPNKTLTKENLMESLYTNKIYVEIKIGTPEQKIPMFLKSRAFSSFITAKNFNESMKKYDYTKSTTFKYLEDIMIKFYKYDFTEAFLATDTFDFGNNKKCDNLTIIIAKDLRESSKYLNGVFGLQLTPNEKHLAETYNMISLLKEKKLIYDYSFSLKYKNNNEGEFIIGKDKNLNDEEMKTGKLGLDGDSLQWSIDLDVSVNGIKIENNSLSYIYYEFGFIESTNSYKKNINDIYFNKYLNNKKCVQIELKRFYYYYVCDDDIDISSFPNLTFYNREINYTFSFNGNELFYTFENKIFFLIIFPDYSDSWSFGKIFLQKYHILLDRDKKIFGLFLNDKNKIKIPFSWILIFILFITLISVLIYIKFFIVKAKRKIRANELDDDYDYISYDNQGEKLIN